jgi:hypothetical protein
LDARSGAKGGRFGDRCFARRGYFSTQTAVRLLSLIFSRIWTDATSHFLCEVNSAIVNALCCEFVPELFPSKNKIRIKVFILQSFLAHHLVAETSIL